MLDRLLFPYSKEVFLRDYWETRYLHVTRQDNPHLPEILRSLISVHMLDDIITTICSTGAQSFDSIRVSQDGILVPSEVYWREFDSVDYVDGNRLLTLFSNGASIILNRVDEHLESMQAFCEAVSEDLGIVVHANAYITPAFSQGLPVHFDTHDVFLLQSHGEKHWRVYEPLFELATPALKDRNTYQKPDDFPVSLTLKEGDLLYLPRGVIHEASTSTSMSIHVTIGMNPYTWSDLLRDILSDLEREDVAFRRSPASSYLQHSDNELVGMTVELSNKIFDLARIRRKYKERPIKGRHSLRRLRERRRFSDIVHSSTIGVYTKVRLRSRVNVKTETLGDRFVVRFQGKTLLLPLFTEPHVSMLFCGSPTSAAELPNGMDTEGKLVLVRRLVKEGLLQLC